MPLTRKVYSALSQENPTKAREVYSRVCSQTPQILRFLGIPSRRRVIQELREMVKVGHATRETRTEKGLEGDTIHSEYTLTSEGYKRQQELKTPVLLDPILGFGLPDTKD